MRNSDGGAAESIAVKVDTTNYRSIISRLRYMTHTARHFVRRGLREQNHGGSKGVSLGCGKVAPAQRQGDDFSPTVFSFGFGFGFGFGFPPVDIQ
jgi:hypothetical protein